jgi:hypothetical protein
VVMRRGRQLKIRIAQTVIFKGRDVVFRNESDTNT